LLNSNRGVSALSQTSTTNVLRPRIDRFGDYALKAKLAGVLQDELAVPGVVAIELEARLV
jgi:hypothetical protein